MQPPYVPRIRRYRQWLQERHGLSFDSYEALRRWSVTEYDAVWRSGWDDAHRPWGFSDPRGRI